MLDLSQASRDDVVELVIAQREALADRDRRIADLEAELATQRAAITRLTEQVGDLLPGTVPPDDAPRDETGAGAAWCQPRGRSPPWRAAALGAAAALVWVTPAWPAVPDAEPAPRLPE